MYMPVFKSHQEKGLCTQFFQSSEPGYNLFCGNCCHCYSVNIHEPAFFPKSENLLSQVQVPGA